MPAFRVRRGLLTASMAVLLAGCSSTSPGSPPPPQACDRACLDGLVNQYLDALVAQDPARLPVADNVRFVENGIELPLGSALWRTASGRGTYSHYFADVVAGQAGFIGTMRELDKGIILVLRLAVADRRITAVEQLAIRTGSVEEYEKLSPDPLWTASVPEAERLSRDALVTLADRYYSGMQRNDPNGDYSFFHRGCNRIEHGRQTTNMPPSNYGHSDIPNFVTMGCEAQFQTGFLGFVTGIRNRRYPVIDEERQAVLAFAFFDHDGSIRSIPLSTGQTFKVPPYFSTPRTLMIAEGFKAAEGKLRLIEAALTESPYGMTSVLDSLSASPARRPPAEFNRGGLPRSPVAAVLTAMLARDPARAPLASDVRYTENGQPLPVGEGLWKTLTALRPYSVHLAAAPDSDPASFVGIVETDIPGQLSLRVRQTSDGRIAEIEALAVRQEIAMLGQLIGTGTLFAPPQLADFDAARFSAPSSVLLTRIEPASRTPVAELRSMAVRYAEALYGGVSRAPLFAERCTARENGVDAVLNSTVKPLPGSKPAFHPFGTGCAERLARGFFGKVGRLREVRVLAADEAQGLVLLATSVDHAGGGGTISLSDGTSIPLPAPFAVPNTHFSATLLKIRSGRIEHSETITRPVFFGMDDGWRD